MNTTIIEMNAGTYSLIFLGAILSISIFMDIVSRRTSLPRISLLVLLGVCIAVFQQLVLGETGRHPLGELSSPLINIALVMVAFLMGSELTLERLYSTGRAVMILSLFVLAASAAIVAAGISAMGYSLTIAISLAAISVATDPAAVTEVVHEAGDNSFTAQVIKGVVAIDDAWGIIFFGLSMVMLESITADTGDNAVLILAIWELAGAIAIGIVIGIPAAWLTGRLSKGEPTLVEAVALILLMAGLADLLHVSALLMAMVAGSIIANLSFHHTRSFREIEHIEWPFLVFFFVLSGASINLTKMETVWWLVACYVSFRLAGRYLGGWIGSWFLQKKGEKLPRDIGLALTPQAGVAMGMALLAAEHFPEDGEVIMATAVSATICFELFGSLLVKNVLRR